MGSLLAVVCGDVVIVHWMTINTCIHCLLSRMVSMDFRLPGGVASRESFPRILMIVE